MSYLQYVNIRQGTASVSRFSHGNTLPLTQRPFGMAAFAPQTDAKGNWFYHPNDRCLEGVRLTHQPSPWVGDFGTLILMPQAGDNKAFESWRRWSGYRPDSKLVPFSYFDEWLVSKTLCQQAEPPLCKGRWHGFCRDGGIVLFCFL